MGSSWGKGEWGLGWACPFRSHTDTLPLWFPDSRYRLLLHPHQHGQHTDTSHRHLAVVVVQQQVPAAPVPTSTPSQHMDTVYPVPAAPVPTSTWSAHGHCLPSAGCSCTHINMVSTQTLQSPTPCCCGSPTAGTSCSCTHINMVSTWTLFTQCWLLLYPHQRQVSTWTLFTQCRLLLYLHQHGQHMDTVYPVPAAPVPTSTPSQHMDTLPSAGCSCTHINMVSTQTLQSPTPCCCGSPTAGTSCSCTHINVKSAHGHSVYPVPAVPVPTSTPSQHPDIQLPTSSCCASPTVATSCSCTHINTKSAHRHTVIYI